MMITSTDIANILYRDCGAFGLPIVPDGETLVGELEGERITIHSKSQQPDTYWRKSYVEVNLCVPDLKDAADSIRLNELQREAHELLDWVAGIHDGTAYRYAIYSCGVEEDGTLKCHYVNVRLLFQVLNVK